MKKIAIVYWSGTGNTEAMAEAVLKGSKEAGADAALYTPETFDPATTGKYDTLAFGCPAMGAEVLEEEIFEPLFAKCEPGLSGKSIGLFGSYGWGDGEWMRSWEDRCKDAGAFLACDSVICCEAPDDAALAACETMGKTLA